MAHLTSDPPLYEIVSGRRAEIRELGTYAAICRSDVAFALISYVHSQRLGWVLVNGLFAMDETLEECRRPAIAWVSTDRWAPDRALPDEDPWEVVPNLVIEMVLPEDSFSFVTARVEEYFRYGVRQVWLVDARRRVVYLYDTPSSYRCFSRSEVLSNSILPGFSAMVSNLLCLHTEARKS